MAPTCTLQMTLATNEDMFVTRVQSLEKKTSYSKKITPKIGPLTAN